MRKASGREAKAGTGPSTPSFAKYRRLSPVKRADEEPRSDLPGSGTAPWEGSCDRQAGHEQGSGIPLNQNRNQNRRRGRGSNRGGQGGGNQGNRIDSRARGNAPQMLEKYRKLAHDASLNGDRVQTEYYLQFADHYFRVIADMRTQKDEQRPRRDDRDQAFDPAFDGD